MSRKRTFIKTRHSIIVAVLAALSLVVGFVPTTVAQNAAPLVLASQFFDAIGGNASLMQFSANAVLHSPEGEFTGRTGIIRFGTELEASFSNLDFATQSVEAVDNLVIVRFALTGVNTGGYHDVEPNCAGFAVPGVAVLQVSDAKVVQQWIGYDSHSVVNQILAYNQFDPNISRSACDAQNPAPAYEVPPSCLAANLCNLSH